MAPADHPLAPAVLRSLLAELDHLGARKRGAVLDLYASSRTAGKSVEESVEIARRKAVDYEWLPKLPTSGARP